MDVFDGFGSKGLSGFIALLTGIVELLNVLGSEGFQLDGTQTGFDVILYGGFIITAINTAKENGSKG